MAGLAVRPRRKGYQKSIKKREQVSVKRFFRDPGLPGSTSLKKITITGLFFWHPLTQSLFLLGHPLQGYACDWGLEGSSPPLPIAKGSAGLAVPYDYDLAIVALMETGTYRCSINMFWLSLLTSVSEAPMNWRNVLFLADYYFKEAQPFPASQQRIKRDDNTNKNKTGDETYKTRQGDNTYNKTSTTAGTQNIRKQVRGRNIQKQRWKTYVYNHRGDERHNRP